MPPQVAQLTRLQRLNLCTHSYSSGSLSCLSAMAGSLTRLHLSSAHGASAGVAVLTRLQHWECHINNEAAAQALAGALPHLAGLTYLIVQGRNELNPLPAALGELAHLESLECLGVGIDTLLSSASVLQQATRLRHLGLHNASGCEVDWESPTAAIFFDWLACRPPLRCLTVDEDDVENMKAFETASFLVRIMQLWRRRPSLLAHCPGLGDDGDMLLGQLHHRNPF
ncbi:hypothetical protein COHA_008678 [Chlorella ohadii]|uniref:Uncharacterized protein n=1 Tax=Chlorella ohadii TaxID=2649997 RepID=A0AAD5H2Z0_9CHLO|nr:hypothetical protein COHA_008678 [Chlorella ohadii]